MRPPNIAICIPAHDQSPTLFSYDLARLMLRLGAGPVANEKLGGVALYVLTGTYVHTARQELAEAALDNGADYILWLDSDMRFPADALERLLMHGQDIVGANYSNRGMPASFTAVATDGQKMLTRPESTGLEEANGLGFGCLLTSAQVFARIEKPWFWFEYIPEIGGQVGEDMLFARKAREAGVKAFVDHDLSQEIGHIGTIEYLAGHALAFQDQ